MEQVTEAEIAAVANKGSRVTPLSIERQIASTTFWHPVGTTLTVCVLVMRNGFAVMGESATASPENFDAALGEKLARVNAFSKIWALEGYTLRNALSGRTGEPVF